MKSWIKRSLLGIFGAGIVLGGLAACGHRHPGWGAGAMSAEEQVAMRAKIVERVSSRLDLDAEQKTHLNLLAEQIAAKRQAVKGNTADPRAEVKALFAGSKFDAARAQSLVNEKTAAVQAASPELIAALARFYDGLRPEQQAKLREFMDKRGGWRRHG